MAFTKVVGAGIHTLSNITSHNINSSGIITATKFVGPIEGNITAVDATFTGNVSIAKTLTYEDVTNVDSVGLGTFREGIFIPDSKELKIGNTASSPDLKLYSDGTNAIQYAQNNPLYIKGRSVYIQTNNNEASAYFMRNEGVKLYYDGSALPKFETTSSGVSIGGTTIITAASGGKLGIGTNNPSAALHLQKTSGTASFKLENTNGTAQLDIRHTNGYGAVHYVHQGTEKWRVGQTAQADHFSIYQSTGSGGLPYRLFIQNNGEVGINTSDPDNTLHLLRNANHGIKLEKGGTNPGSALIQVSSFGALKLEGANNLVLQSGGSQQIIFNRGSTEVARFNTSGRLGIGTISPETNLTIAKNATNQTVATIPTVRLTNLDTTAVATDIVGSYEFFSKDVHSNNKVTGFMRNTPTDAGVNYDLTFGTIKTSDSNAVERVRITGSGQLELRKDQNGVTGRPDNRIVFKDTDTSVAGDQPIGEISWYSSDAGMTNVNSYIRGINEHTNGNGALLFGVKQAGENEIEAMRINSAGLVGIGTDGYGNVDPLAPLHVCSYSPTTTITTFNHLRDASQLLLQTSNNVNNSRSGITFTGALHSTDGCSAGIIANHENVAENSESTSLSFYTSHNESLGERLRINSNGKFCLGTYNSNFASNDGIVSIVNAASSGTENTLLTLWNPTTAVDSRAGIDFLTNAQYGTGRDGAFIRASNDGVTAKAHIQFGTIKDETYAEALRITSGGGLQFRNADTPTNNTEPALILNHAGGWQFYASSDSSTHNNIIFGTNSVAAGERFRITEDGQLRNQATYNGSATTSNDFACLNINNLQGSYTAGNIIGGVTFGKSPGHSSGIRAGMLAVYSDTGSDSSNVGTDLVFRTASESAGDSNEKLRIKANGNIGVGNWGTGNIPQTLSIKGNLYFRQGDYITWNNGDNSISGVGGYHLSFKTYNGSSNTEKLQISGGSGNAGNWIKTSQPGAIFAYDVKSNNSSTCRPAAGDWVYVGNLGYGANKHGKFVVEWSNLSSPGCCHHGYVILEAGTSYGAGYDYDWSESLKVLHFDAHNGDHFKAWKMVDDGNYLKVFGQWNGGTVASGTFYVTALTGDTYLGDCFYPATPVVDNNSYDGTRLTIDGTFQQGATGLNPSTKRMQGGSYYGLLHTYGGLDTYGALTTRGTGAGNGYFGTIWCNYGGISGTAKQAGSFTPYAGQICQFNSGNRYIHVKFNIVGGSMWMVEIMGYEYGASWTSSDGSSTSSDKIHHSISGGYHYNNNALYSGKSSAYRGIAPGWYISGGYICCYIDTNNSNTNNRWGFYKFAGGVDGIIGRSNQRPTNIIAYSLSSSTSDQF